MFSNWFAGLKTWYNEPYQSNMSATRWFLLVGLILLCLAIWRVIVWHLQEAA